MRDHGCSFSQTNGCASERTPYALSLMLQVAGRGYAELLRNPQPVEKVGTELIAPRIKAHPGSWRSSRLRRTDGPRQGALRRSAARPAPSLVSSNSGTPRPLESGRSCCPHAPPRRAKRPPRAPSSAAALASSLDALLLDHAPGLQEPLPYLFDALSVRFQSQAPRQGLQLLDATDGLLPRPLLECGRQDLLRPHAHALGAKGLEAGPQAEGLTRELTLHPVHDLRYELPVLVQLPIQVLHIAPDEPILLCPFGLLGIRVGPRRGSWHLCARIPRLVASRLVPDEVGLRRDAAA